MKSAMISSFRNLLAAFAVVCLAAVAQGDVYFCINESGSNQNAWNDPTKWTNEVNGVSVSPSAITSADGFVVPGGSKGYHLRTPSSTTSGNPVWNGKYLQLGGYDDGNTVRLAVLRILTRGEGTSVTFENDGLLLQARSKVMPYYSNNPYTLCGKVTVISQLEKYPALISQALDKDGISLLFNGSFESEQGRYARIESVTNGFSVTFTDTAKYYGELTVTNMNEASDVSINLQSDFPGTLSISTNATLVPANGIKIANLKVYDGAVIDAAAGLFEVTNSLVSTGKIRIINVPAFGDKTAVPQFTDILRIPADCDLTIDDFEFVTANGTLLECDDYEISVVEGEDTAKVTAVRTGSVTLISADNHSRSGIHPSAMTNESQWSDGLLPTNRWIDYVTEVNLRTYDTSATDSSNSFEFKGHSLTISDTRFIIVNDRFRSNRLVLKDGAEVYFHTTLRDAIVEGDIVADGGTVSFVGANFQTNTIAGSVSGRGEVVLSAESGVATKSSPARFRIPGLNEDFLGTVRVTIPYYDTTEIYDKITPRFDRNFATLFLTDKLNLGGALPELNRMAFVIENMSRVQPSQGLTALTLNEPTRGMFIKWVGRLYADAGQTFTVASPLAVHGTLWKEGVGTLVLANPAPTFGADALGETPDADATNRTFRVAGGDVKIASADAVNGLDVVFTNGAGRLVVDLGTENETLRTFGIRNVKSATPFAVEGDVQKVPVLLELAAAPEPSASCAVVTVSTSAKASAMQVLSFQKSEAIADWPVNLVWRDNEDGSATLVATVKKYGMRIVIR